MMQDETLGLGCLFFTLVLRHVQQTIQSRPDTAIEKLKILEGKILQWQISNAGQQLEQCFLLKELHIDCRAQEFPTWSGLVSLQTASSTIMLAAVTTNFERYCCLVLGVGREILLNLFLSCYQKKAHTHWTETSEMAFVSAYFPDGHSQS